MVNERVYGHIPGFPEGTHFSNRFEAQQAGVHRPGQAGISGGKDGADSIVVSGGYPDDLDFGDEIIYTGHGGQDPNTGRHIEDQKLIKGNLGLVRSYLDHRPVRVIRGAGGDPQHSPETGYRYDGLFRVVGYWHDTSRDGPQIWRYRLIKLATSDETADLPALEDAPLEPARRAEHRSERLVRDRAVAERVKARHNHHCQICGIQLTTAAGPYAEGAHIRGLGRPHNGPDHDSNMLCLCPNDHLLFDTGTIYIDDAWTVWNAAQDNPIGTLRQAPRHNIDQAHIRYHREHQAITRPRVKRR
ncbi:YDG/SRA domain-containing protein [Saccharopolyspora sp. NPDC049357]|uniref:YDG/SRA domain-containing protein n=1 Tax=Saccharopolyspora sp. NPDC049357 TaxID=3154507 RepID=UPI00342F8A81